jgi:tryptophan synthase alpha chain
LSRISEKFTTLKNENRAGLITFLVAGDPDLVTSQAILDGLSMAGADMIEIGIPFSDPMADGPIIQASSLRALIAGSSVSNTLKMVQIFRKKNTITPIILMGYYNPIYIYGVVKFCIEAKVSGVDGLIVVDLPPEEAEELIKPAKDQCVDLIFLATPTTDNIRLPLILEYTSGFIYYVSITGVTGACSASICDIADAVTSLRRYTTLPVAVGFGLKSSNQVMAVGKIADAAVVGSAIVQKLADCLTVDNRPKSDLVKNVLHFVNELATNLQLTVNLK